MYRVVFYELNDPAKKRLAVHRFAASASEAACLVVREDPNRIVCDYPVFERVAEGD